MHESIRQIAALMQTPGEKQFTAIIKLLADTLAVAEDCPESIEAIWHPVGFAYFKLGQEKDVTLRLHAWMPLRGKYDRPIWPIVHSHDWMLTSCVLCGGIANSIYLVEPNVQSPTHRIYDIEHQEDLDHLRATDLLVSCRRDSFEVLRRGRKYELDPGTFHSTETTGHEVVSTLVLARQVPDSPAKVLGEISGASVYTMTRHRCSPAEVRQIVSLMIEVLSEAPE
jgi:hypothetical protein